MHFFRAYIMWAGQMEEDFLQLMLASLAVVCAYQRIKRARRWTNRRWYVHPINQARELQGDYNTLFQQLKQHDTAFFRYTRMDVQSFNVLLELIGPHINHPHPRAIHAEARLAITMR